MFFDAVFPFGLCFGDVDVEGKTLFASKVCNIAKIFSGDRIDGVWCDG